METEMLEFAYEPEERLSRFTCQHNVTPSTEWMYLPPTAKPN